MLVDFGPDPSHFLGCRFAGPFLVDENITFFDIGLILPDEVNQILYTELYFDACLLDGVKSSFSSI